MRRTRSSSTLCTTIAMVVLVLAAPGSALAARASAAKRAALAQLDARASELVALSDRIWGYAETALREHRSAAALADYAGQHGLRVERGVAGMPTAFIASFGEGRPVIGILGEYDALPGISQQAVADKIPLVEGGAGHGCGHNLFGAASLGAAIAVKELIAAGRLEGTVRFYGTPAEESVGGKIYMARDGLFDGLDVVLAWHPGDETRADTTSSQAMVDIAVEFRGRGAHASSDPWNGRSAVDAAEAFTHGINLMREHVKPTTRLHYTIAAGGNVPNVVPDYARVWLWVRDAARAEVEALLARVRSVADGAALMTETTASVAVQTGSWEYLVNETGAALLDANLRALGPVAYSDAELDFARRIQRESGVPALGMDTEIQALTGQEPEGGSSDVADVSWIVPTLHVTIATAPKGVPWHAWPVVATSGMSIGHKGLVRAAKTLAATMVDLYEVPAALQAVRAEFDRDRGEVRYRPYIPDGPPPLPGD
jgi:aminobenzoyl-glutamate utilization protein B